MIIIIKRYIFRIKKFIFKEVIFFLTHSLIDADYKK